MDKEIKINFEEVSFDTSEAQKLQDLQGFIKTVSTVPTHVPRQLVEQVMIYASGSVYRLYAYDAVGNTWRYVALT